MCGKKQAIALAATIVMSAILFVMTDSEAGQIIFAMLILSTVSAVTVIHITGRKFEVSVKSTNYGYREEDFSFSITVINRSMLPIPNLKLNYTIKNLLNGEEEKRSEYVSVSSRTSSGEHIMIGAEHCGCVRLTVDGVENGEPFGFFHRKMGMKASGDHFVLPRGSSVKMSEDRIYAYDMESYKYSQEKPGNDTSETFDIREYNTGDSIKSIHWKLTAKAGEAMVKEPGFPVENNIMIIYDNCSGGTPENIDKFEDLKVGISKELLERKIPHSIGWYDREHGFRTRFVGEESDFWSALMESEKSEVLLDDRSSIYHFIASEVEKNHSNYIYVSNDDRDIERLREYGEVTEQKTRISQ